jgi:hypothetical protein
MSGIWFITSLKDVGPSHNVTTICCEFGINMSIPAQHFEHLIVIVGGLWNES